jgi:2-phospho-L-lactate guanylyltransferase
MGVRDIAIAHGDLPLAHGVSRLLGWPGVTIVPDRHRTGTNVLVLPASIDFRFSYGVDSFQRHVTEAVRHRRGLRVVHDADLAWDIDDPSDLDLPEADLMATMLTADLTADLATGGSP